MCVWGGGVGGVSLLACVHACVCYVCVYVHVCACVYACMHACVVSACVRACMRARVCVCVRARARWGLVLSSFLFGVGMGAIKVVANGFHFCFPF